MAASTPESKTLIILNYGLSKKGLADTTYRFAVIPLEADFIAFINREIQKLLIEHTVVVKGEPQLKGYTYRDKNRVSYFSAADLIEMGVDLDPFRNGAVACAIAPFPWKLAQGHYLPTAGAYLEILGADFRWHNESIDESVLLVTEWAQTRSELLKHIF